MKKGLSLIELLIAMSIMTIIAAVVVVSANSFLPSLKLTNSAKAVVTSLREAQEEAITTQGRHGVRFDYNINPIKLVIFKVDGATDIKTFELPKDATMSFEQAIIDKNYKVTFSSDGGPDVGGDITVTYMGASKIINISTAGVIKIAASASTPAPSPIVSPSPSISPTSAPAIVWSTYPTNLNVRITDEGAGEHFLVFPKATFNGNPVFGYIFQIPAFMWDDNACFEPDCNHDGNNIRIYLGPERGPIVPGTSYDLWIRALSDDFGGPSSLVNLTGIVAEGASHPQYDAGVTILQFINSELKKCVPDYSEEPSGASANPQTGIGQTFICIDGPDFVSFPDFAPNTWVYDHNSQGPNTIHARCDIGKCDNNTGLINAACTVAGCTITPWPGVPQ